ncbi:TonB-dependent receptor plug domain-containing protein [Parabacteroides sp. OttesenSCG-928-G06]|nr:TonB-dependent receptor plug domain-containing protein [Parabacteroides sp. OttesenSCG-928-K15]MDL2282121.1 TonB-dependent receptor plug domain-containing protein [Parabacteroides sp. OttesenSCG-928-G06]
MGAFLVYILKSSVCLAVFYIFYKWLLSGSTFHRFNRLALMGLLFLSLLLPFVSLSTAEPMVVQQSLFDMEQLLNMVAVAEMGEAPVVEAVAVVPQWISIALWVYLLGVVFFVVKMLCSNLYILRKIGRGKAQKLENGIRLVIVPETCAPFSWMHYIVISRIDWEENGKEIVLHETAHIRNSHFMDLIVVQLFTLLHWFNPMVWLFMQELQSIHEYEADASVLQEDIDMKKYQLLLIKKTVGRQRFFAVANSFNHSSLKKRISMMLKTKSNPVACLKYLYVLPLSVLAVVAFARPEVSSELEKISAVTIAETLPFAQEGVTDSCTVEQDEALQNNILTFNVKKSEAALEIAGKIAMVDTLKGRVVKMPIKQKETIKADSIVVVGYGKITDQKCDSVERKLIGTVLKDGNRIGSPMQMVELTKEGRLKENPSTPKPLVLVDGMIRKNLDNLDTKTIESMRVINGDEAKMLYGNMGQHGAILITTKGEKPLFLIDGEEAQSGTLQSIDPNRIESISILKDAAAREIYGTKGNGGVILVTTKKEIKSEEK